MKTKKVKEVIKMLEKDGVVPRLHERRPSAIQTPDKKGKGYSKQKAVRRFR